jgi:hypothetical protein
MLFDGLDRKIQGLGAVRAAQLVGKAANVGAVQGVIHELSPATVYDPKRH